MDLMFFYPVRDNLIATVQDIITSNSHESIMLALYEEILVDDNTKMSIKYISNGN